MNTKRLAIKQSPLFYLALIPIATLLITFFLRIMTGKGSLYFYHSHLFSNQLALLFGGAVCLSLLMLALHIRQTTISAAKQENANVKIVQFFLALLLACLTWLALYDISNFTGTLLPALFLVFVAFIIFMTPTKQWFYPLYAILLMVVLLVFYSPVFKGIYRLFLGLKPTETAMLHSGDFSVRINDIFLGGLETQLYYYPVAENLNNSVLFGVADGRWYDVPAYYGQMTVLKLIHSLGYVPALLLVAVVFSMWVFAASKIYRAKNVNPFWQQLAYYLALFFIVEAVVNIFGNLNILKSVMTTNLMPFSSNAALWLLFIVFGFACWQMQKK